MVIEEVALKLQETTDRSLRNEGRIKKLEEGQDNIKSLATSVAVMAEQLKGMNNSLTSLTTKVAELEQKPAKRWEFVVEKAIYFVVAAVVGFMLAKVGLQ